MDDGTLLFEGKIQRPGGTVVQVRFRPDLRMEPARSQPVTRDQLEIQLKKGGGTPFLIRDLDLTYAGNLFAPLAALNRMRRDFLVTAEEALLAASLPGEEEVDRAWGRWTGLAPHHRSRAPRGDSLPTAQLRLAAFTDSVEGVRELAAAGCERVYFEPDLILPEHRCRENGTRDSWVNRILEAMTICRASGAGFAWKFPRITRDTYLEKVLPSVPGLFREGICECMVGNAGTGDALLREEPSLVLSGSAGLNIFNHAAALNALPGSRLLTLSPELSGTDIGSLIRLARKAAAGSPDFAVIVEGTAEAMITDDCLPWDQLHCGEKDPDTGKNGGRFLGIRDATGHVFPVRMDGECRTRIGNAAETCLIDHLPSLIAADVSEAVIDTRGRTPAYTREICRIYREAVDAANKGPAEGDPAVLESLKERVRQIALGGITTGHFIRGLRG
jgi:putative protease